MDNHANKPFESMPIRTGHLFTDDDGTYCVKCFGWDGQADGPSLTVGGVGTVFGYVYDKPVVVDGPLGRLNLVPGTYFSFNREFTIDGPGKAVLISTPYYHGFNHIGGPIEQRGRLKYIDGCTDSLLIPPVLKGDPCFNLLYFPRGIHQTMHTHPSVRIGIVARGSGRCHTETEDIPLVPGNAFCIHKDGPHCFHTFDEPMTVIAFHPDTDWGAEHERHPMLNRTVFEKSASELDPSDPRRTQETLCVSPVEAAFLRARGYEPAGATFEEATAKLLEYGFTDAQQVRPVGLKRSDEV